MSSSVGSMSTAEIRWRSSTAPAFVTPGQRIIHGVRVLWK